MVNAANEILFMFYYYSTWITNIYVKMHNFNINSTRWKAVQQQNMKMVLAVSSPYSWEMKQIDGTVQQSVSVQQSVYW